MLPLNYTSSRKYYLKSNRSSQIPHFNIATAWNSGLWGSPHRTLKYVYSDNFFGGFGLFKEAFKKETEAVWAGEQRKVISDNYTV